VIISQALFRTQCFASLFQTHILSPEFRIHHFAAFISRHSSCGIHLLLSFGTPGHEETSHSPPRAGLLVLLDRPRPVHLLGTNEVTLADTAARPHALLLGVDIHRLALAQLGRVIAFSGRRQCS